MSFSYDNSANSPLNRKQESLSKLFNRLDDGFELLELIFDNQGSVVDFVFLDVNPAYERQTGLKATNLIGKRKKEVAPAAEQRWYDYAIQAAKTDKTVSYQYYNPKVNAYFETQFIPIPPNQIAVLFKNITERKQAEDALTQTKKNLESIIQQSPIAVALFDKNGFLIQVNDAWEKQWQIPRELVIGKYNILQSKQITDSGLLSELQRVYSGETITSFILSLMPL